MISDIGPISFLVSEYSSTITQILGKTERMQDYRLEISYGTWEDFFARA